MKQSYNFRVVLSIIILCRQISISAIHDHISSRFQVSNAVDHVNTGNTALQKAKSLQKNSRKWMCIAIIILLIIVAVIVVGVLKPWQQKGGA